MPQLIQDLGTILITAAVVTVIFKKLKQPVVLGYLIAGFLLGPSVSFMPTIKDTTAVQIWGEIGVIILLFALGLEFSFKKLAKVGRSASITAIFEIIFMLLIGYGAGRLMNWNLMDSLFLGGILSISSTTIIFRTFEELGLKSRRFVSLVFGVLIIEDIVAILLLVLLSTVAISKTLSGADLLISGVRLAFFLTLWFIVGIYLLPPFMNHIRHLLNDETVLVVALGLCLLMVTIATRVGFSPALGAFVMGSLLSETKEGERIEKLIRPVRDLFAAVFFVSVGLLINPDKLVEYRYEVLFIALITIIGKFIGSVVGSLISGSSIRHSVQVGMSLSQIGEFSFIIATLGLTLNVTSSFLYPIAVAVSAVTTFATPYLIKSADPLCKWFECKITEGELNFFERYQVAVQSEKNQSGIVRLLWRALGWRIVLNTIVVAAVFLFVEKFILNLVINFFGQGLASSLLLTIGSLLVVTPFLWAISFGGSTLNLSKADQLRIDRLKLGIQLIRGFFVLNLVTFFINEFLPSSFATGIVILLILVVLLVTSRFSNKVYTNIETRFIESYEGKYKVKQSEEAKLPLLAPWDVGMVEFVVHPNAKLVGFSLLNAKLKENFGVTVALIQRGHMKQVAPDRNWVIMPFDKLFIIGSDEQLEKIKVFLDEKDESHSSQIRTEFFGLRSIRLTKKSKLIGKIIRDSGIREAISGMIVGIERHGRRILSPDSGMQLQDEDLLWVVGDIDKIKKISES